MKYLLYTFVLIAFIYTICILFLRQTWVKKKVKLKPFTVFSKDAMNALKGFSIVIIMAGHIANKFGVRYLNPLGSLGVAIFLFCSGYGLQKSKEAKNLQHYWMNRIKTVYLPYAVIEIFCCFFIYSDLSFQSVIGDFLLIHPLHPYGWYMQCIFLYYIVFYLAAKAEEKAPWLKYGILLGASLLIFIFLRSLFKQQIFSFVSGVFCAQYYNRIEKFIDKVYAFLASGFVGVGFLGLKQLSVIRTAPWPIFYLIEALQVTGLAFACILLANILIRQSFQKYLEPFYLAGLISYEIYLTHAFLMPNDINYLSITGFFFSSFTISVFVYLIKNYILHMRLKP